MNNTASKKGYPWLDGVMGVVTGDSLGLSAQFCAPWMRKQGLVTELCCATGFGQPKGSWSDDSSMTLATLDSLIHGYDLNDIALKFCEWMFDAKYTPNGKTFDTGRTTSRALKSFREGKNVYSCGQGRKWDNGNGSLMRILPICLYVFGEDLSENVKLQRIHEVSGITHANAVCKAGCGLYFFMTDELLKLSRDVSRNREAMLTSMQKAMDRGFAFYGEEEEFHSEDVIGRYKRLRDLRMFADLPVDKISSGGYVVDTLESAVWSLLNTDNFRDCLIRAVNLGGDADTVGAVTGGLAGIYYGYDAIPEDWLKDIRRRAWIEELCMNAAS